MRERPGGPAGSRGESGQGRGHGDDGDGAAARAKAAAFTKVLRSDDGKLVLVCHDDDRTGELAFCDVYWFPLTVEGGAAGATGVRGSVGTVDAGALAVQGEQVAVEPGAVRGLPAGAELRAGPAGSGEAAAAVQAVKHHGKGKGSGHGKHGKAGRK